MKPEKNWLEWTVFGVSLLLVASTLCALVYWSFVSERKPPDIVLEIGSPKDQGTHFALPIQVKNEGDLSAAGVQVAVELIAESKSETAEFEIPLLPYNSSREGTVWFKTNPSTASELNARVLGYRNP